MTEGVKTYRFLSLVGEGGFGRVYRARMEAEGGFHKEVAIKVLNDPNPDESLLQQFRDEAKMLALVRDRAFVGVEPPIRLDGRWAVVMDFVDGVSTGALCKKQPIPPGVAVEMVAEVARALDNAVHMEGPDGPLNLIHRDIKPDNVQITPAGEVRVLDFGIARANFSAREYSTRRSIGGTPGYIAPERLHGVEVPAGDIYSLGALLHTVITGKRPRYAQTVRIDADEMPVVPDEVEFDVSQKFLRNPDVIKVLTLASWMRAEEPEDRPTARQVEEACRKLRQELPAPFFRQWAQDNVPHRNDLTPDDLIGKVHTVTNVSFTLSDSRTVDDAANSGLAIGALLGGGAAMFLGGGLLLLLVVSLGLYSLTITEPDPTTSTVEATQVVDPEQPATSDTGAKQPETPPAPPTEVAKAPTTPATPPKTPTGPRVIRVDTPAATDPPPTTTEPTKLEPPKATVHTGLVIIQTVPTGAIVREKGKTLSMEGRGYVLPVGSHVLDIESPRGERTRIPVLVRKDDPVEICYSFDTNSACAEPL